MSVDSNCLCVAICVLNVTDRAGAGVYYAKSRLFSTYHQGGDEAQLVEHRTGTKPTHVRFPGAARDFSPRVNFQCRVHYGVRTPPFVIVCIYSCAHVKDPVVHVRVRWIMENLKYPACTVSGVARLCRSWLSSVKVTRISYGRNTSETILL